MIKKISAKFPGIRALVAEDFIVNQELIKEILEMMECEVDVVENGKEAVEIYSKDKYDIIFMDIQMPEMDGYQATQEIRKLDGENKNTPIVAITANALDGDKEQCLEAGMNDYISKPIRAEQIEQIMYKYVGK